MTNHKSKVQPNLLKQINRNMIMQLIIKHGEISRAELARLTELALPSVMRLVSGLIEDKWVVDIGKGDSSGGRKPNLIALNKNALYIFGVEIAIETTLVLTNLAGEIISSYQLAHTSDEVPDQVMEQILIKIYEMVDIHEINPSQIAGIGIGTPGNNFKFLRSIPRTILKGWESVDVKKWFEARIEYPIFVDNVARTRTLTELWFGLGKPLQNFIYVFVDQGVGCGIVKDGHIVSGHNHVAGEFGHSIVMVDGRPCYCGSDGCLEMYVSAGAIVNELNKQTHNTFESLEAVVKYENDQEVENILAYAGKVLGIGISNLINIYNPEAVIIGGRVPLILESMLTKTIESVRSNVFSKYALNTKIMVSPITLKEDGIGGVALVYDSLFKGIKL